MISLNDLMYDNASMRHLIVHKLGISTVEELLFFTDDMILEAPGLGASALTYINKRLQIEGLRLRRNHETCFEYALFAYKSIDFVPIIALNFAKDGRKDRHRVLKVVSVLNSVHSDVRFKDLQEYLQSGHDDAMPTSDIDAFNAQCALWNVQV